MYQFIITFLAYILQCASLRGYSGYDGYPETKEREVRARRTIALISVAAFVAWLGGSVPAANAEPDKHVATLVEEGELPGVGMYKAFCTGLRPESETVQYTGDKIYVFTADGQTTMQVIPDGCAPARPFEG
jgi:hypothetical protein